MTPQESLDIMRIIRPGIDSISNTKCLSIEIHGEHSALFYKENVQWPEGVTQWPHPEKWRIPTDDDAQTRPACRFRDYEDREWDYGMLILVLENKTHWSFVILTDAPSVGRFKYCEIEVKQANQFL